MMQAMFSGMQQKMVQRQDEGLYRARHRVVATSLDHPTCPVDQAGVEADFALSLRRVVGGELE